jgi:ankyrin repeat protein
MSDLERLIEAVTRGDLADVKRVLESHPELLHERDQTGATPLHYAAIEGHRSVVRELVSRGADINATDARFDATPTGWAIHYLREMGGFLAIELNDVAHAIRRGDVEWVTRFLRRHPALRDASDTQGTPLRLLAEQSGDRDIAKLFDS